MIKVGILDPTKVVRYALQDAASVAGLLVTTEAMVAEKPEPKPAMPPSGAGAARTSKPGPITAGKEHPPAKAAAGFFLYHLPTSVVGTHGAHRGPDRIRETEAILD
jgi:hypothetical protein